MTAPYLRKMERSSVVQYVIDCLTDALLNGELKPGDRIPTEIELSQQLGVARNSVREAIKILVYLGVLEIRRPDGTFVCEGFSESLVDPMIYGMILSRENIEELNEVRAIMESSVLRLAIEKCTDEEIEQLKMRLDDLRAALLDGPADPETAFERDNAFHDVITGMCQNAMVAKLNSVVLMLTWSTRKDSVEYMIRSNRCEELYQAHERVYDLVASRRAQGLYDTVRGTYFVNEK